MATSETPSDSANQQLSSQVHLLLSHERELTLAKRELEHAMARNVSLQQMSQFLITTQSMDDGLQHTVKALVADMSFEKSLMILHRDNTATVVASSGYTHDEQLALAALTPAQLEKVFAEVNSASTGQFVADLEKSSFDPVSLGAMSLQTFLAAPLMDGQTPVGFLLAGYSQANSAAYAETLWLSDRDAVWFSALANQVSAMATNAKLIASLRDRTSELHAEQARLHASIDGLSLGFMLTDASGEVVLRNRALNSVLGLPDRPVTLAEIGAQLPQFDLAGSIERVQSELKSVSAKSVSFGAKILRLLLAPVVVTQTGGAKVLGAVVLIEDITEEKVLERSRDEFFSIASHELRTPLTAIKGNSSMLLSYYPEILKNHEATEMINDIHEASERLIDIVSDFLDVSRLEQGKIVYHQVFFGIDEVVEKIFYELASSAKNKQLQLVSGPGLEALDKLPKVFGDPDRAKQILYNLLGNALKFTTTGSVTVDAAPIGTMLKVTVDDTGAGIPTDTQMLLFHKFQQAGESILTRDTTRGTGMGLYISKLLAEGMGGTVRLEKSVAGEGTTFSATFLTAEPRPAAVPPSAT